ncbi:MAG: DUF2256 domain-containing protein [Myxococcota bacterium]
MSRRAARAEPSPKWCATCGRIIEWRKKWADDWDHVRYCSKRCRRNKPDRDDAAIEQWLRAALSGGRAVDPMQAQAALDTPVDDFRERARSAARRIAAAGDAVIVQQGRPVDPSAAKGDFFLRSR